MARQRDVLAAALGLGLALRLGRVARAPLMHPDGPAYLGLATELLRGDPWRVLGGYYSPAYPALVALAAAAGVPLELAGRLVATAAGVAALPLLWMATRRLLGTPAAAAAVLTAAGHPALVKASAHVLPETLAGALLLGWLVVLQASRTSVGLGAAGLLAGGASLTRPEYVLLLPLGLVWGAGRHRPRALATYAIAVLLVLAPVAAALHARTGAWQLSPREAAVLADLGVGDEPTLLGAVVRRPGAVLLGMVRGGAEQMADDLKALGVLLWVPFAVGLAVAPPARATALPVVVVGSFTLLPLALNPSPRYAVPLVALLLPWTAVGLLHLGTRLGRRAPLAAAALGVVLSIQGLWISHPFDLACSREVSGLILERYGPGQALVAVDGRFAYGAQGRALVPAATDPGAALALARRKGARLWLTRASWIRPPWQPPAQARAVARPCGGTFVLFELDGG
jgi:hypothetical protein